MSMTVEIVFTGLIALVMDKEIPPKPQAEPVKTGPVSAFLLKSSLHPHKPKLLILKTGAEPYMPTDDCKPLESDDGYYSWDLSDRQIVVEPDYESVANYRRGPRNSGTSGRHYHRDESTPERVKHTHNRVNPALVDSDLSWVPEMRKVHKDAKLRLKDDMIAASMFDIRGTLSAAYTTEDLWDWCYWSAVDKKCLGKPNKSTYDQALAGAVAVQFSLRAPQIVLLPRSTDNPCVPRIVLKGNPRVWVSNHPDTSLHTPSFSTTIRSDSKDWCSANDFAVYYEHLEKPPIQELRPFFLADTCTFLKMSIPGSDTFCPPVIFTKP
jgi:hypothetical protein